MLCASIKEKNINVVVKRLSQVPDEYDLIEIWVNEIENLNIDQILSESTKPLLFKITDSSDDKLIAKLLKKKVSLIDVDIDSKDAVFEMISNKKGDTRLLISSHDFEKTPPYEDLLDLVGEMKGLGADIGKIVTTANDRNDNFIVNRLLTEKPDIGFPLITFCMGMLGQDSRIDASKSGSAIDFVPPDESWKTADGQFTLDEWKEALNS